ncbi:hypothetical protein SRHO_G00124420 [Serrasalmus rhombeus]
MRDSRDDSLNTSQTHPNTLTKKASTGLECFCCIQSRLSLDQRSGSQRFPEVMRTKPRRPSVWFVVVSAATVHRAGLHPMPEEHDSDLLRVVTGKMLPCPSRLGASALWHVCASWDPASLCLTLSSKAEHPVISHFSKSTAATITVAKAAVRLDCSGSLTREGLLTWTSMCPNSLSDNSPVITCLPLRKQPGRGSPCPALGLSAESRDCAL